MAKKKKARRRNPNDGPLFAHAASKRAMVVWKGGALAHPTRTPKRGRTASETRALEQRRDRVRAHAKRQAAAKAGAAKRATAAKQKDEAAAARRRARVTKAAAKPRHKGKKATTMAKKRKKAPKVIYRAVKKGGRRRRTAKVRHTNVFRTSKKGSLRRVRRINPRRRHHRHNPGLPVAVMAGVGALAGLATGVVARVGAHMIMPGSDAAQKGIAGVLALGGMALATKFPMLGVGIATGAVDAVLQNVATFKAEMLLAPSPHTVKGLQTVRPQLGAIQYENMRGVQTVRPQLGAIQYENMRGMGSLDLVSSNPFDR